MHQTVTVESIQNLEYPDFIGFLNQWNTPPGAFSTISKLVIFSFLDARSNLLDVACSTGFSSREMSLLSGCRGTGIDTSESSIHMADYNKKHYAPEINITYKVADGYQFNCQESFSHVMVGGNLKFFTDPKRMLDKCVSFFDDEGYLLATPYYEIKKLPKSIVDEMHEQLGLPFSSFSHFSYKDVVGAYRPLESLFEERCALTLETEDEIQQYCDFVVERACTIRDITDKSIHTALRHRLLGIRRVINESRKYQEYVVLVLRYRKSAYPHRYIPLF